MEFADDDSSSRRFDAVVVGTGLVESMLAAALARAGERVLHVDAHDYYGNDMAGFATLEQVRRWAEDDPPLFAEDHRDENAVLLRHEEVRVVHSQTGSLPIGRRLNVDLDARLVLASGEAVDALVALGVAHYLEFAAVGSLWFEDQKVPCSKKDVFTSADLSPAEKRKLMRVMRRALDAFEDDAGTLNERELTGSRALRRPQNKRLDETLVDDARRFVDVLRDDFGLAVAAARVVCAAAFVDPASPATEGWHGLHTHLRALGAHAGTQTALLAPIYGTAEFPQALCRACAVRGGVYALRRAPSALAVEDGKVVAAIFPDGARIPVAKAVVAADYLLTASGERAYRRVAIVESSDVEPAAIVYEGNVRCVVLGESANAVDTPTLRLVHLSSDSLEAIRDVAAKRDDATLWSLEVSFPVHPPPRDLPSNLAVCRRLPWTPRFDLTPEVDHAKALFERLRPGESLVPPPEETPDSPRDDRRDDDDDDLADLATRVATLQEAPITPSNLRQRDDDAAPDLTMPTPTDDNQQEQGEEQRPNDIIPPEGAPGDIADLQDAAAAVAASGDRQ
ncbi:hypothetical protein CTAYLR_008076 [Chrysophaeum taylorii]|uniref:Rab proteins geranylgeranyltransferase component A n=1 Tax=Chrysophaeum taylorii TaxID=2483200 RepID=A0AAD7UK66_9STRA|nr:hypothetical protein CTAYLR_008076 [Chrysophaeum taylorii]